MGPFEGVVVRDDNEPLYCSAPQNPEDIIWAGSDTEQTPKEIHAKRRRYEEHARRYLRGQLPVLQSARLRGPLDKGWVNPWTQRPRKSLDWWQPGSEDMLFTRANVMKWAADRGLGHLTPKEALARCKAAAKAQGNPRGLSLGDHSANTDISGSTFDVGYQTDSSEDPLSQSDDVALSHSDPIVPPASLGRSSVASRQRPHGGNEGRTTANGQGVGTKRGADLQWLKGSSISKRARWDSSTPPSPSPMRDFQGEQVRQRVHEYKSTGTLVKPQIHTIPQLNISLAHGTHSEPEVLLLEDQREDLDELGDVSRETTVLSALDSIPKSKAAVSTHQSSDSYSHDDLAKDSSPTKQPSFSTPGNSFRKEIMDSGKEEYVKLPARPRRHTTQVDPNVEALEDDSFITEVAPSSSNAGTFKYRKRRGRAGKRTSPDPDRDAHGQVDNSVKPLVASMPPGLDEKPVEDGDARPEISPNDESHQDNEERETSPANELQPAEASPTADMVNADIANAERISSPVSELQPAEASPIAHMRNTERESPPATELQTVETSPIADMVNAESDSPLHNSQPGIERDMLDDTDPQPETSFMGSLDLESLPKSDSEEQCHAPTEAQPSARDGTPDNAESHTLTSGQNNNSPQSSVPRDTESHRNQDGETQHDTSSESTEEIIQSQIRAEMNLSMQSELSSNLETGREHQLCEKPPLVEDNALLESSSADDISPTLSNETHDDVDAAVGEYEVAKPADLESSTPRGCHQEQESQQGGDLQSPWTADNIQLLPSVVLRDESERWETNSSNRDTQREEGVIPDSDLQSPERPQSPKVDGIIPFKDFMSPSPSPSRSRARPSFGEFPNTQALVDAATSNPWATYSEPRPKKRVSFGLPEEKQLGNMISFGETPKSPPPPQNMSRLSQDDVFNDGTTAANTFQKHFAAAGGASQKPLHKMGSPFPTTSPAISAMADAFIAADRKTSAEHGRLASGDKSPSRYLQPISQAMVNSSADREGASPSRSPLGRGSGLQVDLDEFLGEAGGFLEEWSVEMELRKTTEGVSRAGYNDGGRRLFEETW